jgi:hypothetical protein
VREGHAFIFDTQETGCEEVWQRLLFGVGERPARDSAGKSFRFFDRYSLQYVRPSVPIRRAPLRAVLRLDLRATFHPARAAMPNP